MNLASASRPLLAAIVMGCSAGNEKDGPTGSLKDSSAGDASLLPESGLEDVAFDTTTGDGGCASSVSVAKQAPASALILLDRSSSMSEAGKWSAAGIAIASAIDDDAFDTMSLGLLASPSTNTPAPKCLRDASLGLVTAVACGNPALPQVAVKPAGKEKSAGSSGVRSEIYKWLAGNSPFGMYDATPMYEAIKASYAAVRLSAAKSKRLVIVITDGTLSCASVSAPMRKGYVDGNGCFDWEDPENIISLVKAAHDDPTDPVLTFFIGVPGSDVQDPSGVNYPPYSVLAALSAAAKVGAPEAVDATCEGTFKHPGGVKPAKPCHFDMSKTGSFDAKALATAITKIRGAALGCIYDLPVPADGSTVDRGKVNVRIESASGGVDLKKRADPTDMCPADGCWDYTADGRVELIGKACADAKAITDGKVTIVVGCKTIVK